MAELGLPALQAALAGRLPLPVDRVEGAEPLVLGGDGWTLQIAAFWRVVGDGRLRFGVVDAGATAAVQVLAGDQLVEVRPQSPRAPIDPALVFASGLVLEVFAEGALEPWRLTTGDGVVVGTSVPA